jgi:hypothetical protein
VLEREASEKRGTSGKELDADCAGGRRGSGGGREVGGSDKGKKWGRKHCGKQARCAGGPQGHLEPSSGPSTCIRSQAILFVFFNCIMELSSSGQEEGS